MKKKQIRSMMRIPLNETAQDIHTKIRNMHGKTLVVIADEPCFTCGRYKRMQYANRQDGKVFIIEECLFCLVRIRTAKNREIVRNGKL